MSTESNPPLPTVLLQMASGYWLSQCIYVAAKLGIADLLQDGAQECDLLASLTNTHSDSLYRLLRALASVGIFAETKSRCFELTPLATYLQSDRPGSVKSIMIMFGEEHYQAWGSLLYSVQTGNSAFEKVYGVDIFNYLQQHPQAANTFEQAMTDLSIYDLQAVSSAYNFTEFNKIVDVGGGRGSLLVGILQQYSHLQGILFDEPYVVQQAESFLIKEQVRDRCELKGGNFFESIPTGGDVYLLKHIIHDWGDRQALTILQKCYQAMNADSKLLVIDRVISPGNEPFGGKLMDLNMLAISSGGKERTETEFEQLLAAAKFQLKQIIPTAVDVSVIEAVPI